MLDTFRKATPEALAAVAEEMKIRQTSEVFLLFVMGCQFDHLIFQALARLGVLCLVADPASVTAEDVAALKPKGIILSGGPSSAYENPPFDSRIFDLGIPILGICLGFQIWAHHLGVTVQAAGKREFGIHTFRRTADSPLFAGLPDTFDVLESHGDRIEPDPRFTILGATEHAPVAAAQYGGLFYGVQFHPETTHTEHGDRIFENFCFGIAGARDRYPAVNVAERKCREIAEKINGKRVLLALSGGSDSSVTAHLIGRAVEQYGARAEVLAVYVRGVDRPDDEVYVQQHFGNLPWLRLKVVDATDEILESLRGRTGMREKRRAFRPVYSQILAREARAFEAHFIAQGTLFTDISESGGGYASGSRKAVIKEHHNVGNDFGGIPELTPLADCVKDNARDIGRAIGVPEELLTRHPFPGPGGVVRIEGEVIQETLSVERTADGIYIEELRAAELYAGVWQAGAVVTEIGRRPADTSNDETKASNLAASAVVDGIWQQELRARGYGSGQIEASTLFTESVHTCTKGSDAASGRVVVLSAVRRAAALLDECTELPNDLLRSASRRITDEVSEVGAVVYSLSDVPASRWHDAGTNVETVVALWAVWSVNGFTARWAELPHEFLRRVARRIMEEVRGVGAVVYRISDKPPATIEWG